MRTLFIPFYFFYKLFPYIVFSIILFESCQPKRDWDRIQFDMYRDYATDIEGIPYEILILREIKTQKGADALLNQHPKMRGRDMEDWIKELNLSKKQALKVLKFKTWLLQLD